MGCPILNSLAKCSCSGEMICIFCVQLVTVGIGVIGSLVAWKPKKAIEMQIAFYRPLNWKIEPISIEKEIRNTRIMGLTLLAVAVTGLVCIFLS